MTKQAAQDGQSGAWRSAVARLSALLRRKSRGVAGTSHWDPGHLLNLTHDAIVVRDMTGRILYWNCAAEKLYGWTSDEAVGGVIFDLLKTTFPAPLQQIEEEVGLTGRWEGELVHAKKDGGQVIVASRWALQRDGNGTPVAILSTNNDVTERKHAEGEREALPELETYLAHMNRVTAISELTASLAQELNQPITATINDANACLRWLTRDPPVLTEAREAAMSVIKDGTRAAEIIDEIDGVRSLYPKGTLARHETIDVNEVVREMFVLLRNEANRHSVIMLTELADLSRVLADRVQLQQVFMNLILNAIDAMKVSGGELSIKSRLSDDGGVLVSVGDTGVGLPAGDADQLFKAFFTTKPQGIGIGLAISRSIIESHGGRLWASPNTPRGALFQFSLPAAANAS